MKIPPGHTEASVLEAIDKAVNILAPSFVFGTYSYEDIKQQGALFAIQALEKEKYKPELPLPNFLYAHIRNRLINLRRDKLCRNDAPCMACHHGTPCGDDGKHCQKYAIWKKRNAAKSNLMRPMDLANVPDENEQRARTASTVVMDAETKELLSIVDAKLPVDLRASFLQLKAGVQLPKPRRKQVEAAVREILGIGTGPCPFEED